MLNIALIGVDSGHFEVFSELILGKYSDRFKIQAVYGDDREQALQKIKKLGLSQDFVVSSVEKALQGADAAMVLGRFADSHLAPAIDCFKKGIPVFIDKPVVNSSEEFKLLMEAKKTYKGNFISFSIYRFSETVKEAKEFIKNKIVSAVYLTGPRYCKDLGIDPRFEDIYFYGIHSTEIMLELLGDDVTNIQNQASSRSALTTLAYNNGEFGIINFSSEMKIESYFLQISTDHGIFKEEIHFDMSYYDEALNNIHEFFTTQKIVVTNESSGMGLRILDKTREASREMK